MTRIHNLIDVGGVSDWSSSSLIDVGVKGLLLGQTRSISISNMKILLFGLRIGLVSCHH